MGVRGGAGKLKHRITVQALTSTTDASGYPVNAYADLYQTRCAIEPLKDIERIEARQVEGFTSHRIRMRYHRDLRRANRILFGTRTFDIEGVHDHAESRTESVAVVVEVD